MCGYFRMQHVKPPTPKDYSDMFLAAILIGIVVVVLGVMMAVAHSTSRSGSKGSFLEKAPRGAAALVSRHTGIGH